MLLKNPTNWQQKEAHGVKFQASVTAILTIFFVAISSSHKCPTLLVLEPTRVSEFAVKRVPIIPEKPDGVDVSE